MVDGSYGHYVFIGSMPYHHTFPALLQLPRCLRQESGTHLAPLSIREHEHEADIARP